MEDFHIVFNGRKVDYRREGGAVSLRDILMTLINKHSQFQPYLQTVFLTSMDLVLQTDLEIIFVEMQKQPVANFIDLYKKYFVRFQKTVL